MSRRAEASEARRDAVLRATSELLDEQGVSALTVRAVAERAGVAQGSVFLYAESKADLVDQVYGLRITTRWHDLLDGLADEPPLDRIERFYLGCVEVFYDDLDNVQAFYAAISSRAGRRPPSLDRITERITAVLADAAESGALRPDVDLEALDLSYQALYAIVIRLAGAGADRARARHVVAQCLQQLRHGVSA